MLIKPCLLSPDANGCGSALSLGGQPVQIGCGLYLQPVQIGCGLYLQPAQIRIRSVFPGRAGAPTLPAAAALMHGQPPLAAPIIRRWPEVSTQPCRSAKASTIRNE